MTPSRLFSLPPMLLTLPDVPLRTSSFALEGRWLLWAKARLYADRLVLSGWGLWDRYWRKVPLNQIEEVERNGQHLSLQIEDGSEISLLLRKAERWSAAIRTHRRVQMHKK